MPAHELWLEKTGQLAPVEDRGPEVEERLEIGSALEETIARLYAKRLQVKIRRRGHEAGIAHKEYPFLVAHPDFVVVGERRGMDSKNVGGIYFAQSEEWGEPGTDQVPTPIYLQAMHYLAVLEYDLWDIAALVGGNRLRIYTVARDDEIIKDMVAGEVEFWRMVETRTAPPLDYDHPRTLEILQRKHKVADGSTKILPDGDALLPWCATFEESKAKIKEYQAVERAAKARILETMGEASALVLPDGSGYTRKRVEKKAYEVAAQSYIELRRKAAK